MRWAGARCGDGAGSWQARWRHGETGERRWWCDGDDEGDEDGDDVVLQRWMRVPGGSCGVAVRVKHGAVRHCRGLSLASQEQEGTRANTSHHALRHTRSTASLVNITISKYACVRASYPQLIIFPPLSHSTWIHEAAPPQRLTRPTAPPALCQVRSHAHSRPLSRSAQIPPRSDTVGPAVRASASDSLPTKMQWPPALQPTRPLVVRRRICPSCCRRSRMMSKKTRPRLVM
jgi:hypothetical protein